MPLVNALAYLGLAKQTVEGTPVAPVKFIPWQTLDAGEEMNIQTRHNGFSRDLQIAAKMRQNANVKFKTFLYPDTGSALLCWALAATDVLTGASDPFVHTMAMADAQPALLTVETSIANGALIQRIPDNRINTLSINMRGGEFVEVDVDLPAKQPTRQASAATVTFEADRPCTFLDSTFTFTTLQVVSADIMECKFDINNGVKGYQPAGAFAPRYLATARSLSMTGKAMWADQNAYRQINWGGTSGTTAVSAPTYEATLVLLFDLLTSPDHQIQMTMNNVVFKLGKVNFDVNADVQLFDFQSDSIRTTTAANMLTVVGKNAYNTAYN